MPRMSRPVLLHRLKTAGYAIATVVLASWITDALNEGLIFKPVLRYFYPDNVRDYQHPFSDTQSLMLWGLPLLLGLLALLALSALTVHHFKKRHLFRISRQLAHPTPTQVVTYAASEEEATLAALRHLPLTHLHVLHAGNWQAPPQPADQHAANAPQLHAHRIDDSLDLHQLHQQLNRIVDGIRKQATGQDRIAFDLDRLSAPLAAAATLICQENDFALCYLDQARQLRSHELIYQMGDR